VVLVSLCQGWSPYLPPYLASHFLCVCPVCTAVFLQLSDLHSAHIPVFQFWTGNPTDTRTCTILPRWNSSQNPACRNACLWHTRPHLLTDTLPDKTVSCVSQLFYFVMWWVFDFSVWFSSSLCELLGFYSSIVEDSGLLGYDAVVVVSDVSSGYIAAIFKGSLSLKIKARHTASKLRKPLGKRYILEDRNPRLQNEILQILIPVVFQFTVQKRKD
jgi:hypothetical protein